MQEISFTQKDLGQSVGISNPQYNFYLLKPMNCPYCNAYQDAVNRERNVFTLSNTAKFAVITYECTHCHKIYVNTFQIDLSERKTTFIGYFPEISLSFSSDRLEQISPRFIDMYNQALKCESSGNKELAAIGFRASLEILVKDYAIKELHKTQNEVIEKSLYNVIGEYLPTNDLVASADVIRILGNDYTHYERKYPEHDFELLKQYMNIFIQIIETQIMINHPPVSRNLK